MKMQEQEGGFVRNPLKGGYNRRRASTMTRPKVEKTWEERQAEREEARQRWLGVPPLVVAREMIAEAELPDETVAELTATISRLTLEQLGNMIESGQLTEALEEASSGIR